MVGDSDVAEDRRTFWNTRAGLGFAAGTRDVIAKKLEIQAISKYVRDGMRVLDVGCGNGVTAVELAKRYSVSLLGIDFAQEMVASAMNASNQPLKGSLRFQVLDVRELSKLSEKFDLIYTERTLINLTDWPTQERAIIDITNLLVDGGLYVMCENSQDGLDGINLLREQIGLPKIIPPWHNRYLRNTEIQQISSRSFKLEAVNDFSSTYYFLSRIVNAWLAAQNGQEPSYEAPVNQLALKLPPIGGIGQTKIWLWRKGHQ
jgi:ubiquinone/menaquinone biosynthesis C-methylase UbiE